jgi:hypothetical protein
MVARAKHNSTGVKEHPTLVLVDERMFTAEKSRRIAMMKKHSDGRFEMATDSQVDSRLMFAWRCEGFGAGLALSLVALP